MTAQRDFFNDSPERVAERRQRFARHEIYRKVVTVLSEAQLYGYPNLLHDTTRWMYDHKTMPIWHEVRHLYFPALWHVRDDEDGWIVRVTPRLLGADSPAIASALHVISRVARTALEPPSDSNALYDWH